MTLTRLSLALVLLLGAAVSSPAPAETVHLIPDDKASFGMRNLFGWVRPGHYYEERRLEVETTPPGAQLDLFYVRANFQKRYEQAVSPATVLLPKRVEAGDRDSVTVRAYLAGYKQKQVSVRVHSSEKQVLIELSPLPNTLRAVAHTYFGGRAALTFLTDEAAQVRIQDGSDGFTLVLNETAQDPSLADALGAFSSPVVGGLAPQQLGDDLLVRVALTPSAASFDLRQRATHDPVRDLYSFSIDMIPPDGGAAAIEQARAALARVHPADVGTCARRFDEALRGGLDEAALERALAPRGAFTDPYLRAAMRRLGEISPGGAVEFTDGQTYRPGVGLELSAAMSVAGRAKGYLAFLRAWVRQMEGAGRETEALRSLVAPELPPADFERVLAAAESSERSCRG